MGNVNITRKVGIMKKYFLFISLTIFLLNQTIAFGYSCNPGDYSDACYRNQQQMQMQQQMLQQQRDMQRQQQMYQQQQLQLQRQQLNQQRQMMYQQQQYNRNYYGY